MGVERFFSSLKRDYNFIHSITDKINCDHLLIDFNSIVHITSQFLLEHSKDETTETFETKLIEEVGKYILDMLKNLFYARDIKSITICVDGVPSMAKIYEQKKRRYMGNLLTNLKSTLTGFSWSRNNISPGTQFMNNMMSFIKSSTYKDRVYNICHSLIHYNVSGIDEMGEGEIKIIHYINKFNKKYSNEKYIVYSPDSDVIILLLMKSIEDININMLRYDQQLSTYLNPIYNLVDIDHFKNILFDYIQSKTNIKLDKSKVIMDLVFLLTVFGDDFLPKLETVRVHLDINILLTFYVVNLIRFGYILSKETKWYVNTENFLSLLALLEKKEEYFLQRNARHHISSNYHKIVNDIVGYNMNLLKDYIDEYLENKQPKLWNKMLEIINEYFIEILQCISGEKLKEKEIHTNEVFYILDQPIDLLKDIIDYYTLTKELPITIPLKTSEDKLMLNKYYSSENPHKVRLIKLDDIDKDFYKIEHKLDEYYKILNPQDKFYKDIYFNKKITNSSYYSYHFPHINSNKIVEDYLIGLNWIVSYYHNTNPEYKDIDLTWYYPHNRSPLLKDIVNRIDFHKILSRQFINKFNNHNHYMTPLEHLMYVSPFDNKSTGDELYKELLILLSSLSYDKIMLLVRFIKSNHKFYYPLDKLYHSLETKRLVDCSSSIFISKCHLLFMENYIDMMEFIGKFRKTII